MTYWSIDRLRSETDLAQDEIRRAPFDPLLFPSQFAHLMHYVQFLSVPEDASRYELLNAASPAMKHHLVELDNECGLALANWLGESASDGTWQKNENACCALSDFKQLLDAVHEECGWN